MVKVYGTSDFVNHSLDWNSQIVMENLYFVLEKSWNLLLRFAWDPWIGSELEHVCFLEKNIRELFFYPVHRIQWTGSVICYCSEQLTVGLLWWCMVQRANSFPALNIPLLSSFERISVVRSCWVSARNFTQGCPVSINTWNTTDLCDVIINIPKGLICSFLWPIFSSCFARISPTVCPNFTHCLPEFLSLLGVSRLKDFSSTGQTNCFKSLDSIVS